jgi:hypothetical protein
VRRATLRCGYWLSAKHYRPFCVKSVDGVLVVRDGKTVEDVRPGKAILGRYGELAGIWYTAATNAHRRWAESDFLLPVSMTTGKISLQVEIRVLQGPWSEYRYELWGLPESAGE